ncbi:Methionine--tRNA ligase, mitochondrial [Dufourea novaeangliae]|uniref:Methionine--tRNA ligase, mitochondrial n=1 Tax=Dufourea novaeangliae TaxID=178035 RepID=A0A154PHV6_DUFNO|nr:Methionine--tRNA ligase, mitochondrial [Dufourea novaeangliae]
MTSRMRLEKVLEDLQKNPYFDKYAEKIAKLQKTSPDEFLQRVDNQAQKSREKKEKQQQGYKFYQSQAKPNLDPNYKPKQAQLSNIMKVDMIQDKTKEEIVNIWKNYHKQKDCISGILAPDQFDKMFERGKQYPTFLLPLPREHGYEFIVTQFYGTEVHMTPLLWYQAHKENSPECLSMVHYLELRESKGIVLMRVHLARSCSTQSLWAFPSVKTKVHMSWAHIRKNCFSDNAATKVYITTPIFYVNAENTVQPAIYHKILFNWIEEGLEDLSISRPVTRVPWAIPTPSDKSHTIYVWVDALVNYLTSIGYPDSSFKQFWPPTVQVVGKDILKFHGIYWPALLMAVGLEPPKKLLCHGHWTVNDQKMSKSKGNVISPFDAVVDFTSDGLRYFLLRQAVLHADANYNTKKIQNILNAELANTLGNLVNRCLGKSINPRRVIPDPSKCASVLKSEAAIENIKVLEEIGDRAREFYEEYCLHHVVDEVMSLLRAANIMFDHHKPWHLCKSKDLDSLKELEAVISLALESVRVAAIILQPIVPTLTSSLLDSLEVSKENRTWDDTRPLHVTNVSNRVERTVSQKMLLFKKIKD